MDYSQEDKQLETILDENQKQALYQKNKDIQEAIERYSNVRDKSVIRAQIRRESVEKRKHSKNNRRKAIIALLLAGTALASTYAIAKNIEIKNPITSISQSIEESNRIDDIISNYQKMMNIDGEYAIESFNSRDENNEPLVYYNDQNINNLVTVITTAAEKSEEEFRCAVLAAYKIINEPYREKVLDEAFKQANAEQEETAFSIPTSTQEYLEILGYEDLEDYNNNERKNIKALEKTEIKMEGRIM